MGKQTDGGAAKLRRNVHKGGDNLRQQQASALAYFDTFLIFAILAAALTFLVLLMKRSVAEKGTHVAAE